jgi:hypothetical protein
MQGTVGPLHFFQVHFAERGKLDRAVVNMQAQQKWIAVLKMQSQQFAVFKNDIPEAGIAQFGHAELAAIKNAI